MKIKSILVIVTILFNISNRAQCNTTVNLDSHTDYGVSGYYYKDINNILDPFAGRYLYTNGTTSFEIILQKKVQSFASNSYCEDMIVGSYRYVKNGVEKVNVLNDINNVYVDGDRYKISANTILTGNDRGCTNCGASEKWLNGYIDDPVSNDYAEIFIRLVVEGGQPAIMVSFYKEIGFRLEGSPAQIPFSLPNQDFILIKQ